MLSLGDGEGNIHKPKGARVFPPPLVTYPCSVENLRGSVRYLSMQASSDKNRLQQFTTLALAVSKRVLPNHGSKFAPKTYTQPQLLACLLLKEYLLRSTFVWTIAPLRKCLSFPTVCARLSNCLGHPITVLFGGSQGTS